VAIHDLYFKSIFVPPHETYTVLIVYSDAMLPRTIPAKCLQLISWRYLQVIERDGRIQNSKFLERPTNAKQYYCKAVVFKGSTHFFLVEWRLQN